MTSQFKIIMSLIILFFYSTAKSTFSELPTIKTLEQTVSNEESRLDSLRQIHLSIINQSDIIIQEIKTYHVKSQLSRREHRELEKALQKSQDLEQQIRGIQSLIDTLSVQYQNNLNMLINQYQSTLEILIMQMEHESDESVRTAHLKRFQELDKRKRYWESKLSPIRLKHYQELQITQHPQDSKQDLQFKGNLLLDREEALRDNIASIDHQILSFKREHTIRKKAESFSREMALFDENEERMGRHSIEVGSNKNRAFGSENGWDYGSEPEIPVYYSYPESDLDEQIIPDMQSQPFITKTPRTADEIMEAIRKMEIVQSQLNKTADSLHQKAVWFLNESVKSAQ
jgi:hypothetical protein